ncbi:MAG: flagellar brake protein [Nitrospirae bacterium YQR-1]
MATSDGAKDDKNMLTPKQNALSFEMEITGTTICFDGFFVDIGSTVVVKLNDERLCSGTDSFFRVGDGILVKYYIDTKLFFFESKITKVITDPALLVVIAYPEKIERMERRKDNRIKCQLPCKILLKDNKIHASITNISDTGCKCELYESSLRDKASMHFFYEDDYMVNIIIPVGGTTGEHTFNGKLKYLSDSYDSYHVGVEFCFINTQESHILETILKRGW